LERIAERLADGDAMDGFEINDRAVAQLLGRDGDKIAG
jgi:hypothetical protein